MMENTVNHEDMRRALDEHSRDDRRRQSKRALLIVFVVCPAIAIGLVLLAKLLQTTIGI